MGVPYRIAQLCIQLKPFIKKKKNAFICKAKAQARSRSHSLPPSPSTLFYGDQQLSTTYFQPQRPPHSSSNMPAMLWPLSLSACCSLSLQHRSPTFHSLCHLLTPITALPPATLPLAFQMPPFSMRENCIPAADTIFACLLPISPSPPCTLLPPPVPHSNVGTWFCQHLEWHLEDIVLNQYLFNKRRNE